jgi:hypothetical protein
MTPTLKEGYEFMKRVGAVRKLTAYRGTPHVFESPADPVEPVEQGRYLKTSDYKKTINRQTLNKLIALGYAKYTDAKNTQAVYVDKDAIDAERDWWVAVGKATQNAFDHGCHIRVTSTEGLYDLDDLLKWDKREDKE